jgi:hypothetical protein
MGGIEYDKNLIIKAMEEVVTYETIKTNDFYDIVGMVAERLNCMCIDKDRHYYLYINKNGALEGEDTYVFDKIMNLMVKHGYINLLNKRRKQTS